MPSVIEINGRQLTTSSSGTAIVSNVTISVAMMVVIAIFWPRQRIRDRENPGEAVDRVV